MLVIVYSNTADLDLLYILIPKSRVGNTIRHKQALLVVGEVSVSVFVVEKGGLPFHRVVSRPKTIHIPKSSSKLNQRFFIKAQRSCTRELL